MNELTFKLLRHYLLLSAIFQIYELPPREQELVQGRFERKELIDH